jgi:hypothetical protein
MSSQPASSLSGRLARIGAIIGVTVPLIHGLVTLLYLCYLTPPLLPGQTACGMPAMGACFEIFVCPPLGCVLMASIGWFVGAFIMWDRRLRDRIEAANRTNNEDTANRIQ